MFSPIREFPFALSSRSTISEAIDKKLFKLIDEVCKEAKLEFLIPDFDRARNLRNSFMHPEGYSVMGIFSATKKNFVHFNNVINQLIKHKSFSLGLRKCPESKRICKALVFCDKK